jgi:hypothetical protein
MNDKDQALASTVRRFLAFLDRTEESDSGRAFHPVSISCCRAQWVGDLNKTIQEMQELSKEKQPSP